MKDKKKEILKEDLCLLAFDVHVNKDAQEYADKNGVTILTADIIYHLKDKYRELEAKCFEERKKEKMKEDKERRSNNVNKIYQINHPNYGSQEVLPTINRGGNYQYNNNNM